jgi:unsaturated rhamnogalacturonyl hydrolase
MSTRRHACASALVVLTTLCLLAVGPRPVAAQPAPPKWGVAFADLVMARWPDPTAIDPDKNGWEYNTGIVLFGMSKVYEQTRDPRYLAYIRRWVDAYVNDQGQLGWDQERSHNLDYIQPGMLILFLYEQTGAEKYRKAAATVRAAIDKVPRNAEGGFWHKGIHPNEMWIDGIYMGQPFLVRYGKLFGDAAFCNDTAVFQATLVAKHAFDERTGLLFHAWDQDRNAKWANPRTGVSPEIWSRGMGWYVMALVDVLEVLPAAHPGRPKLLDLLRRNAEGLRNVQDPKTGLWFQVLDKGDRPDNWIEVSSSGMFTYALRKAVRLGYIDASYAAVADRAWKGLPAFIERDGQGRPVVTSVVKGMDVQADYAGYLGIPRLRNSTHGLMSMQLAASEMER